ncbi:hypothetical protein KJ359_006984 [Pestalotiopsis sp. 9143b]|nr:hypothetical protein KJ359_006984 [Pestalotiopsis sp. 9143b]
MTSLYKQSIPVLTKYLNNFAAIVRKGEELAKKKSLQPEEVIKYRLISDMQGLSYQVQSCCNTSVWFVDRVGKLEHAAVEDKEETFDQLVARIERTIEYLNGVDAAKIDAGADQPLVMETRMGNFRFESGQAYFSEYALPNFHFHMASGYCILRTQGAELGALDYLKDVFHKVE